MYQLRDLVVHEDDRGTLFEALRSDWDEFAGWEQCYVVRSREGAVRAFHKHDKLIDYFTIVHGTALFVLWKPDHSLAHERVVLTVERPQLLVIPAGVFHGWKPLGGDATLLSNASQLYNYDSPDEDRAPWDFCGRSVWDIQNR